MYYTESAEYLFASEALNIGWLPCWPSTEAVAYDMLLQKGDRIIKIQVKTVRAPGKTGSYRADLRHSAPGRGKRKSYTSKDADFIVVYAIQDESWYIFPIGMCKGSADLKPHNLEKCKYKKYFEAWELLELAD